MADRFLQSKVPSTIGNANSTYQLGNKLGQGGFGVVYMGLNTMTGMSVAVKSVMSRNLTDEARDSIQTEINLLKMLDHPNIVKYIDTIASGSDLYIVLEYMENGSIGAMRKKFRFQEPLIAHYVEQVLRGLEYLHNQGVLHRDIKGANILTTKNGEVKLADFGVAVKSSAIGGDSGEEDFDVVGTPYWMAPEIIQMSKPTEACDVWSVGCTVIELVTSKPPYYDLQPMQALFRIVQDDYPPFPEGLSTGLHDFLIACFQKDPNMRPRASDLLRPGNYRWLQQKTRIADESASANTLVDTLGEDAADERDHEIIDQTVRIARQQTNTLLQQMPTSRASSPAVSDDGNFHTARAAARRQTGNVPDDASDGASTVRLGQGRLATKGGASDSSASTDLSRAHPAPAGSEEEEEDWDAEFGDDEDTTDNDQTIRLGGKLKGPGGAGGTVLPNLEIDDTSHGRLSSFGTGLLGKTDPTVRLKAFRDDENGDDFGLGDFDLGADDELRLATIAQDEAKSDSLTLSNRGTSMGDELRKGYDDEDDPFADFDDDEDDREDAALRDRQAEKLRECMALMAELTPAASDDEVETACSTLVDVFTENPRIRENLMTQYGVVPIMEMLTVQRDDVLPSIVRVINVIIKDNERIQEHVSLMGLLPIMIRFAKSDVSANSPHRRLLSTRSARKPRTITPLQVEATRFVRTICIDDAGGGRSRKTTLQMFIGCGGLELLVHLLSLAANGDLRREAERRECICTAIDGITRVFTLQTLRKNDFCRLLAKYGMILYLLDAFDRLAEANAKGFLIKVAKLLEEVSNYSRADVLLKDHLTQRTVLWRVVEALRKTAAQSEALLLLLKSVKHVCMSFGGSHVKAKAPSDSLSSATVPQGSGTIELVPTDALTVLEESGIIEYLVELLDLAANNQSSRWGKEVEYQVVPILFYLCLVNKKRQEKAAVAGLVPHLRRYIEGRSHLQQFATQLLCDLAHASNATRRILQEQGVIELYMRLLHNQNWDHSALDAVAVCFAANPELEDAIVADVSALVELFCAARARKLQMILENLVQMTEGSVRLSGALGDDDQFMKELVMRLHHANAFQRTNLLKLLKAIYRNRSNPSALIGQYDLYDLVVRLANENTQIVVKQLASELLGEFNRRSSTYLLQAPKVATDPPGEPEPEPQKKEGQLSRGRGAKKTGIMRRLGFKRMIS